MNSMTLHTFPSIHAFNSARGWFLALIVLLHVGFFWALTHGLSIGGVLPESSPIIVVDTPATPAPQPQRPLIENVILSRIYAPKPEAPQLPDDARVHDSFESVTDTPPERVSSHHESEPAPTIIEPQIDPRIGLSEPAYPAASIRGNETGTVILAVQVLANGRVGEVRIVQSSGYERLDRAALSEARRWRLRSGMRDGVATPMWKEIPITFRLNEERRF